MSPRRVRAGTLEVEASVTLAAGRVTVELDGGSSVSYEALHVFGPEWLLRDGDACHPVHVARRGDTWWVHVAGRTHVLTAVSVRRGAAEDPGSLHAPMPGKVLTVLVGEGDVVEVGTPLLVLSAMKMQVEIKSPIAGIVKKIPHAAGEQVDGGAELAVIEPCP